MWRLSPLSGSISFSCVSCPAHPSAPPTLCSQLAGAQPAACVTLILVLLLPSAQASSRVPCPGPVVCPLQAACGQ